MAMDERASNKWRFRITRNGQKYVMEFNGDSRAAKKAHEAFKVDVDRGNIGLNENMVFNDLCKIVMEEYVRMKCRYNTQQQYKNCYNTHILDYFGLMKISSIRPLHVQRFVNSLTDEGFSSNTVRTNLTCLRKSFTLAVKWGFILKNPCIDVDKPSKKKNSSGEILSLENIQKLLDIYEGLRSRPSKMHKVAFYIAFGCGLRNSEIRALTLDDIDFKNNIITVDKQIGRYFEDGEEKEGNTETKSDSSIRKVYAPQFVIDNIQAFVSSMHSIPITKQIFWSHVSNKPVGRQCISSYFTNILIKNDLPVIDFHDLRHVHATLMINNGVNMKTLSTRLGHSRVETTNIYLHNIDQVDKQAADIFDNAVNNIKGNSTLKLS